MSGLGTLPVHPAARFRPSRACYARLLPARHRFIIRDAQCEDGRGHRRVPAPPAAFSASIPRSSPSTPAASPTPSTAASGLSLSPTTTRISRFTSPPPSPNPLPTPPASAPSPSLSTANANAATGPAPELSGDSNATTAAVCRPPSRYPWHNTSLNAHVAGQVSYSIPVRQHQLLHCGRLLAGTDDGVVHWQHRNFPVRTLGADSANHDVRLE